LGNGYWRESEISDALRAVCGGVGLRFGVRALARKRQKKNNAQEHFNARGLKPGLQTLVYAFTVIFDQATPILAAKAANTRSCSINTARTTDESSAWPHSGIESGIMSVSRYL